MWKLETYISKKIQGVCLKESGILLATYNLQQKDPKAKHVGFNREKAFHCIFRRHVTTEIQKQNSYLLNDYMSEIFRYIGRQYMILLWDLLSSNYSICICLNFICTKYSGHTKI
jgi:hypothetical protein